MRYLKPLLDEHYKIGKSLEELSEVLVRLGSEVESINRAGGGVLDIEITPNRGDLLSHFGLARELSASELKKITPQKVNIKESPALARDTVSVEIKSDSCPLYMARVIKGVKVTSSPDFVKARLRTLGVEPINNIVDVTNYVMFDLGHPLHAFDLAKISAGKIIVREVKSNEEVVTLDGKPRELLPGMLVIADERIPVAIAGVMGLKNSEVDEDTRDIVLEAAVFDRRLIRKTAKALGLQSEASYRFERGVDEEGVRGALDRAAAMIAELSGGEVLQGVVEARRGAKAAPKRIKIEYEKISRLAGKKYAREKVERILDSLGFEVREGTAKAPSWRHDIGLWQDLAEEVIRIDGIEKIKPAALAQKKAKPKPSIYHRLEAIKDCLAEMGLDEALNYSFLSEGDIKAAKISTDDLVEVANPVQDENRYLRNSLAPALLKSIARNPSFDDVEFFEIGNVFDRKGERTNLAIATAGRAARKAAAIAKKLSDKLGIPSDLWRYSDISREELKRFKIKKPSVSVAEITLDEVLDKLRFGGTPLKRPKGEIAYRPISKFPPVKRDLAFVVGRDVAVCDIIGEVYKVSSRAVLAEPFDEFISGRFGKNKKSIAFHIWLERPDKTLSDREADKEISKIIDALRLAFGATLRA